MCANLCSSEYPKRLKIPRTQACAGSSPAPSILYTQLLTSYFPLGNTVPICVRTQFLRTTLQQSRIIALFTDQAIGFISCSCGVVWFVDCFLFYRFGLVEAVTLKTIQSEDISTIVVESSLIHNYSFYQFFACGKRGGRGIRDKSLSQGSKCINVANVAPVPELSEYSICLALQTYQSYLELRKKCVIQFPNSNKFSAQTYLGNRAHGIVNRMLLSILVFSTLVMSLR